MGKHVGILSQGNFWRMDILMKKIGNVIKQEFNQNKSIYIIGFIFLLVMIYTHFNTFLANDDLPYSFLYRGNNRIISLGQVLQNQLADYKNLNARFFVHSVLQIVLMFGKNLWSIINPLMITISLILLIKIVKLKVPKINNLASIFIAIIGFLLMFNYKAYIYWVAGSINYIWVLTLLLICLYLYFRYGFSKYKFINVLGIAFLCALHECTMVFTIIFILGNFIYTSIKNKKIDYTYFIYFIGFLGSLFLFLSPASKIRMDSDEVWNSLNFIQKLLTAIPVVSKNLFDLKNVLNILPYLFIGVILFNLYKIKSSFSISITVLIILNVILIYLFNNNWLYFSLVLLLVIGEYYSNYKNDDCDLCLFSLAMYAVIYSNILTPLYYAARPNYYFYIYIIFYIIYVLNKKEVLMHNEKIINIIVLIPLLLLLINEVIVYTKIGNYHKTRLEQIENYKNSGNNDHLVLIKIPDKYNFYHMDINNPTTEWFTYRYFLNYYELPNDIEIVYE